jgi:hypothetical protein
MINKAQATLEFTVVFVIMIALLIGMISLWLWSSSRIVSRQIDYNAMRVKGGQRSLKPEVVTDPIYPPGGNGDVAIIRRESNL